MSLRSQIATLKDKIGRKYSPYVFTEQGVAMLGSVESETAVFMSIKIMRAFVVMRKNQVEYLQLSEQYRILENKQQNFEIRTDQNLKKCLMHCPQTLLYQSRNYFLKALSLMRMNLWQRLSNPP